MNTRGPDSSRANGVEVNSHANHACPDTQRHSTPRVPLNGDQDKRALRLDTQQHRASAAGGISAEAAECGKQKPHEGEIAARIIAPAERMTERPEWPGKAYYQVCQEQSAEQPLCGTGDDGGRRLGVEPVCHFDKDGVIVRGGHALTRVGEAANLSAIRSSANNALQLLVFLDEPDCDAEALRASLDGIKRQLQLIVQASAIEPSAALELEEMHAPRDLEQLELVP